MLAGVGLGDYEDVRRAVGETAYHERLELDSLLAQLRGLHSIRPRVLYDPQIGTDGSSEGWLARLDTTDGFED